MIYAHKIIVASKCDLGDLALKNKMKNLDSSDIEIYFAYDDFKNVKQNIKFTKTYDNENNFRHCIVFESQNINLPLIHIDTIETRWKGENINMHTHISDDDWGYDHATEYIDNQRISTQLNNTYSTCSVIFTDNRVLPIAVTVYANMIEDAIFFVTKNEEFKFFFNVNNKIIHIKINARDIDILEWENLVYGVSSGAGFDLCYLDNVAYISLKKFDGCDQLIPHKSCVNVFSKAYEYLYEKKYGHKPNLNKKNARTI